MIYKIFLFLLVTIMCSNTSFAQKRTWTDVDGKRMVAEMTNLRGIYVSLKNKDGKIIRESLKNLSDSDVKWVAIKVAGKVNAKIEVDLKNDAVATDIQNSIRKKQEAMAKDAGNMGVPACLFPSVSKGMDIDYVRDVLGKPTSETFRKYSSGDENLSCRWNSGDYYLYVSTEGQRVSYVKTEGFSLEEIRVCKSLERAVKEIRSLKGLLAARERIIRDYQAFDFEAPREWKAGGTNGVIIGCDRKMVEIKTQNSESGKDEIIELPISRLSPINQVLVEVYADYHGIPKNANR